MDKVFVNGKMEENILVNLRLVKCMALVSYLTRMVGHIKESIMMTKNMAEEFTPGLMGDSTMVNGAKAKNMVWGNSVIYKDKLNTAYGNVEKENHGYKTRQILWWKLQRLLGLKICQLKLNLKHYYHIRNK